MPKRVIINTYGISELELTQMTNLEFAQLTKEKRFSPEQVAVLKNHRRLLKVRGYGKDFRRRERDHLDTLREEKQLWEAERQRLRAEIGWYKEQVSVLESIQLLDNVLQPQDTYFTPIYSHPYFLSNDI